MNLRFQNILFHLFDLPACSFLFVKQINENDKGKIQEKKKHENKICLFTIRIIIYE